MFVVILFGYAQKQIYTTDSLTASLMDYIWKNSLDQILVLFVEKKVWFTNEIQKIEKEIAEGNVKLEAFDKKLQEEALLEEQNQQAQDKKATKAPAGKDKKGGQLSGKEKEREDLVQQIELNKTNKAIYEDKLKKLDATNQKFQNTKFLQENYLELLDSQGERKFVKTKLNSRANTFLTDKMSYQLALVSIDKEVVEPFSYDGYCVRTVEQDTKFALEQSNKPKEKDVKKATKK